MKSRNRVRFILTIVMPLALAAVGIGAVSLDLLLRVSDGANTEEHGNNRRIAGAALDAVKAQFALTVTDNSHWDDASRHLNETVDPAWFQETFGETSEQGEIYDAVAVYDIASGKILIGKLRGKEFQAAPATYFGPAFKATIDRLPKDFKRHEAMASFVKTPDGLAVFAAAPVVPTSEELALPDSLPRVLLMAQFLDEDWIDGLGKQYVLDGLTLKPTQENGGFSIDDLAGQPLGQLAWTDKRPGDKAGKEVWLTAIIAFGMLTAVMLGVAAICWRLIRRLENNEQAARDVAMRDGLTGLPNRLALNAELAEALRGPSTPVTLMFVDLDGFKEVNDTYDHETGDKLLRAVAAGLPLLAGANARVCRVGGDEFVFLITGARSALDAQLIAQRAIAFAGTPFNFDGRVAKVGASVGIATAAGEALAPAELMRRADVAMYRAKESGKGRFCVYDPSFDSARQEAAEIQAALRGILTQGLLETAFQPKFSAATRELTGVEALARWPQSVAPVMSPDRFIPIAESCGLIKPLGEAVLAQACREARHWPDLTIAVNVSPVQLRDPDFVDRALNIIDSSGLARGRIEFEITEGTLIDDMQRLERVCAELRAAGMKLALDDFGAGYSGIGYLRLMRFDRIKIDRSLTANILTSDSARSLIQAACIMARGLGAEVTAEGVETEEQAQLLHLAGCTELQGYLLGKPQAAETGARAAAQAAAA